MICVPVREISVPHTSAGPATKAGLLASTVALITKRTACTTEQGRIVVALAEAKVVSCVIWAWTSEVFLQLRATAAEREWQRRSDIWGASYRPIYGETRCAPVAG
jgi:hypothetical protein